MWPCTRYFYIMCACARLLPFNVNRLVGINLILFFGELFNSCIMEELIIAEKHTHMNMTQVKKLPSAFRKS